MTLNKLALLLACSTLAACVTPTKYASTNPVSNEKLGSVQISYPLGPPKTVGAYVMKAGPEREKNILLQHIGEDARLLAGELANRVPKHLAASLASKGIRSGTENTVSIRPLTARGTPTRHEITMVLEISVKTSDRTKPVWVAEITEASVPNDLTGEKMSVNVADRIVTELTKAGFVPQ